MTTPTAPSFGFSIADLRNALNPKPEPFVHGLLAPGLTLLIGRPKTGKSWLALQIANAISTGTSLWDFPTTPAPVLYLALEDSADRLSDRAVALEIPEYALLTFVTSWQNLEAEAINALGQFLSMGVRVLIIDTLTQACGPKGLPSPARLLALLNTLRLLAQRHQAALLLIDHQRASRLPLAADQAVLGGAAHAAAVDAILHLRTITPTRTFLDVRSRDLPPVTLSLRFDSHAPAWRLNPDADDEFAALPPDLTPSQAAILDVLRTNGPTRLVPLAIRTAQDAGNLCRRLQSLQERGLVTKYIKGRASIYALPGAYTPEPEPVPDDKDPAAEPPDEPPSALEEAIATAAALSIAALAIANGADPNTVDPDVYALDDPDDVTTAINTDFPA